MPGASRSACFRQSRLTDPPAPRKYVNLLRNSLICAAAADQDPVNMDEILLAAPVWLNDYDQKAGAVGASDPRASTAPPLANSE